jgi:uncharacterized protein YbaP (TraB family)
MLRHACFFICLFNIWFSECQSYDPNGNLLWEIKKGNKKSYIWGTLHSNDKQLFVFPDSVYWAFLKCQKLAVEIDVFSYFSDKDCIPLDQPIILDKRGKLYTSSDEPTKTYYGDEDGMPQFMDAFFQEIAEERNMPVIPLESPQLQNRTIFDLPLQEETMQKGATEMDVLKRFYLQGRIDLIDKLIRSGQIGKSKAYKQLIEDRNIKMAETLLPEITKSAVFCAVGAAHLYGEKGVLQILRSKGWLIRAMNLVTSKPINRSDNIGVQKIEVLDTIMGTKIKAVFPGVPKKSKSVREFKELGQGNTYSLSWYPRDSTFSLLECAELYIAPPPNCPYVFGVLDDGTEYVQGLSDAYPERLTWKRIIINEHLILVIRCQGGNKFMNSDRPNKFFNSVVLE